MLSTMYTAELVQAAQNGDPDAINALLLYCQPDLKRFAQKVCATPEDVEDAVQETLWVVSKKIKTLRAASAFTSWTFRVVKRHCLRLIKEERWEFTITVTEEWSLVEGNFDLPDVFTRDLVAAIVGLAPLYREVLLLRDVEGLTAPAVAERLGITVEAVKSRLHRARAAMRIALGE